MIVPQTVAETLKPEVLKPLEDALAPPPSARASATAEIEVEVVGEGTFTLRYEARALTGKKGFAKKALLSAKLGKGSWKLLRDELQAAADGFPSAPALQKHAELFKQKASTTLLDAAFKSVEKLAEGAAIVFDIKGEGVITIARGPVDEATKELKVSLDGAQIRGLLTGAPLTSVKAQVSGDRSVGTALLAAFGPLLQALNIKL